MTDHNITSKKILLKEKYDSLDSKFKKTLTYFMIFTILILGATAYKVNDIRTRAYIVELNGETIGMVKSQEEALDVIERLKTETLNTYNVDLAIDGDIELIKTNTKERLMSSSALMRNLRSNVDLPVKAFSFIIAGENVGAVRNETEAQLIIDKIKEPYVSNLGENEKLKEVKIVEDFKIENQVVPLSSIASTTDLIEYIKTGTDEIQTHVVEAGESFWTIAKIYSTSVDDLIEANPDVNPTRMKPGDQVKLLVPVSKMTVATRTEVEYIENTDFEVIVEKDSSMYTNQQKVKVKGEKGESKIIADQISHNGKLVEKEILSEEVISKPVDEIIVKGTKEVPKTAATGSFMTPTRGRFTSGYGRRWGRMHNGIDLAASTGTAIKAADGGTVTFAGYKGSFGYLVEVDHGNGFVTRYAHCSKIHVSRGSKVYKGQHIANVGNTGNSTGPHLHFEVLKNGSHVNPSNYL